MDSRQQIMDRDVRSLEFLIEAAPMEQVLPRQFVGTQRWFWCGLIEKDRGWFSDVWKVVIQDNVKETIVDDDLLFVRIQVIQVCIVDQPLRTICYQSRWGYLRRDTQSTGMRHHVIVTTPLRRGASPESDHIYQPLAGLAHWGETPREELMHNFGKVNPKLS